MTGEILAAAKALLANVEPPLLRLGLAINDDAEIVCAECGGGFRADKDFVISHASRCPTGVQPFKHAADLRTTGPERNGG